MGVYTLLMVLTAGIVGTIQVYKGQSHFVPWTILACAPFFAIPGLSDARYFPIDPNSPVLGGVLAAVVAYIFFHWHTSFWQILVGFLLTLMVFWSAAALLSTGLGEASHALGLEMIFYCIMCVTLMSNFLEIDDFPNPIAETVRAVMVVSQKWLG